jgi:ABC-2 type transport system ATP-binding protein
MESVIIVKELYKTYGDTRAVAGVSFQVGKGEIFGMVGPNGAGKTTTIECVEGLREGDQGEISVLGLDPISQERKLRPLLGIQLQEAHLPANLKVWEALDMYASFYERHLNWEELLKDLGLADKRNSAFRKLSGGQKQRLFIALALLHDPELVFLDELTTGLDPHARRVIWDLVREVCQKGKTIFLTTHYMEEAENLCDRVAIMDRGKIVALDTPANLIQGLEISERVSFKSENERTSAVVELLPGVKKVERQGDLLIVYGRSNGSGPIVTAIVNALTAEGISFRDLRTEQPDLEDVFLALTGRQLPGQRSLE